MTFLGFFPSINCFFFCDKLIHKWELDVQRCTKPTQHYSETYQSFRSVMCVLFFSCSSWFRNSVKQKGVTGFVSPWGTAMKQPSWVLNSGFVWKKTFKGKTKGQDLHSTQSSITREELITIQLFELWQQQPQLHD